jgi:hypothetical protein
VNREAIFGVVLLAAMISCGDDAGSAGSGGGTTSSTTSGSGGTGGGPPADSCVQPGDMGNEIGVGEYCTPLGGQCADNSVAQFCLADVGQDQWMCTRIGCDENTDCGANTGCLITDDGSACVPCRCDDSGIGCATSSAGGNGGGGGMGGGAGGR